MVVDHYILLGVHLSSKAEKNKPQIEQIEKGLLYLKSKFPSYSIILGGDLNSYLKPFNPTFWMYPSEENQLTTIKKRTMTQAQIHKGEKIIEESKDKIISTVKIIKGNIFYINGSSPKDKSLIPTNNHPFDHFVIMALLETQA